MVTLAFPSQPEALISRFVRILNHVERVHLRNRLSGELKGDVAKIQCCSSAASWRALMKLCGEKLTSLVSTACGYSSQAALFNQVQEPLLLIELTRLEKEV